MTKSKPRWGKTNIGWDIKKIVWQQWALGDTVAQTVVFFELHQGEYKNAPLDRATIKKVREELLDIPVELVNKLIDELPEVKSLVLEQRADLKGILERTLDTEAERSIFPTEQQKQATPLVLEAQKEHLDEIRKIILDFKKLYCDEDYIVSSIELTLSLGELWRNPLFRSLREHIPNQAFWSQYSECQTRLLDYTSNRNTLEAEIRDSLDQWPGIQRLEKYCQVPIIINIIHKAFDNDLVRLTGERDYHDVFTYECGGPEWKSLLARNLVDKEKYEILIAEKPTDYIAKYVALSNNLLNSEKAKALGTSYVGLSTLLDSIGRVLSQTLTSREYILHTCQLCPEIVKQK